ncbi:MAG: hypothetical protein A2176_04495 [Spirochaetes bacterium RBG_13_51_14]|nr:MAG: hypothetical protein A2176_04495 [Spirochaetes bacterium RBG_13_51_14]
MILLSLILAVSCKVKKEMSLEDYAKIELEINLPSPDLDTVKVEEVTKKYGYTYQQFTDMFEKVKKDAKLKEKLGEIRLQEHRSGK